MSKFEEYVKVMSEIEEIADAIKMHAGGEAEESIDNLEMTSDEIEEELSSLDNGVSKIDQIKQCQIELANLFDRLRDMMLV